MDSRLLREDANDVGDLFPTINSRDSLEKAIKSLENCVKNGTFYQAAELSDWITFVAENHLRVDKELDLRLKIERLKRFSYLGYKDQANICRSKICKPYQTNGGELNSKIISKYHYLPYYLFTAIGLTLWHNQEIDADLATCEHLNKKITDDSAHKPFVLAFLSGLRGRLAYLKREPYIKVRNHFDNSFKYLGEENCKSRAALHLIIYYLEHLLLIYADGGNRSIRKNIGPILERIDELFDDFEQCRAMDPSTGEKSPLKTILAIHFLALKLRKLEIDKKHTEEDRLPDLYKKLDHERATLLSTVIILGFGNLKPLPPLMDRINNVFDNELVLYDDNCAKIYIEKLLNEIDWKGMEAVAATYFRQCGYTVEVLPDGEQTFDLLIKRRAPFRLESSAEDQPLTITGVQVKHWKKQLDKRSFDEWMYKAGSFHRKKEISHVIFFLSNGIGAKIDKSAYVYSLPKFIPPINIITLRDAVNLFWQHPSCFPTVFRTILEQKTKSDERKKSKNAKNKPPGRGTQNSKRTIS